MTPAPNQSELNPHAQEFVRGFPDLPSPIHQSTPGYVHQEAQHEENDQRNVLGQLVSLLSKRDHLPPMEPEVFTGDMMKFPMWLKSFECIVERNACTEEDKLFYLGKYTGGEAKMVISMYLNLEGEEVYRKAKMALKRRYGERYHVAEAFKQKLHNWPNVKYGDGVALRQLSDFLDQCNSARKETKFLDCLDSADENQKLLKKLPRYIVDRWKRIIDKWLYGREGDDDMGYQGKFPPFEEFCTFLRNEARIACGPGLIGVEKAKQSNQPQERVSPRKKISLAASVNPHCNVCGENHSTENCEKFLSMEVAERRDTAKRKGICYKCLRKGHLLKECRRNGPSLIFKRLDPPQDKAHPKKETETTPVKSLAVDVEMEDVFHTPITEVLIHTEDDPANCVRTYALLDSQSNACFISDNLAKKMNAKTESVNLKISTVLNKNEVINSQVMHGLFIKGVNETTEVPLPPTYTRNHIPTDVNLIPKPESIKSWPHLKKIAHQLPSYNKKIEVGLLIGVNCSAALLPQQVAAAGEEEPYAIKTVLGWGILGNVSKKKRKSTTMTSHFAYRTLAQEVSPSTVNSMYEQEFNESRSQDKVSIEDQQFFEHMKSSYQREDGHFELPLPLKGEVNLPNNRELAMKRLLGLHAKMKKNEQFCADYVAFMKNNIDKGYAEKVPLYDVNRSSGQIWYIPHHGVYHPKKPEKIRVVFDCSSEFKGETLNRHLLQGPDLINSLPGILVRFRQESVAFTCDIEGMFHQMDGLYNNNHLGNINDLILPSPENPYSLDEIEDLSVFLDHEERREEMSRLTKFSLPSTEENAVEKANVNPETNRTACTSPLSVGTEQGISKETSVNPDMNRITECSILSIEESNHASVDCLQSSGQAADKDEGGHRFENSSEQICVESNEVLQTEINIKKPSRPRSRPKKRRRLKRHIIQDSHPTENSKVSPVGRSCTDV